MFVLCLLYSLSKFWQRMKSLEQAALLILLESTYSLMDTATKAEHVRSSRRALAKAVQ